MLRLLVALDFSDCSRQALSAAISVVEHVPSSELVVLTVLESLRDGEMQSDTALGEMERAVGELHKLVEADVAARPSAALPPGARVHYTTARGTPADTIIDQARKHHVDAIVLGTHGRTGLNRLMVGSVAEMVVRHAPCSVLTVKPNKTA